MAKRTDRAYAHIREMVVAGDLPVGGRLSPAALAQKLEMSHIPVREALTRLRCEGLLEHRPGRGTFVRRPQREELIQLIELRSVLESNAAAVAARRIEGAQFDELSHWIHEMQESAVQFRSWKPRDDRSGPTQKEQLDGPWNRWILADLKFHFILLHAAGNQQVVNVINGTRVMTEMFGYRTDPPDAWKDLPGFFALNFSVHYDVFLSVKARDPKAARRGMRRHMKLSRQNLLSRYDWLQGNAADSSMSRPRLEEDHYPAPLRRRIEEVQRELLPDPDRSDAEGSQSL